MWSSSVRASTPSGCVALHDDLFRGRCLGPLYHLYRYGPLLALASRYVIVFLLSSSFVCVVVFGVLHPSVVTVLPFR